MNIDGIENFLSSAYPYAETSKRTYRDVITRILGPVQDPASLTAAELIDLLSKSGWGNKRQCVGLAACQKYLAWRYGSFHPALCAKLKRIPSKPQRSLTKEVALHLLASFDPYTAKGSRDLAICALLLDTGLRESEICRLQLADTDLEHRVLQCLVKGGQWKAAVFSEETAAYIGRWLHYRMIADGQGFLFTNTFTGKAGKALKPKGLYSIVKLWGEKIGIKLCVHDFRRSFATLATDLMGAPERVLMAGGRWSNSQMIHQYTQTLKLDSMRKYLPVSGLLRE